MRDAVFVCQVDGLWVVFELQPDGELLQLVCDGELREVVRWALWQGLTVCPELAEVIAWHRWNLAHIGRTLAGVPALEAVL